MNATRTLSDTGTVVTCWGQGGTFNFFQSFCTGSPHCNGGRIDASIDLVSGISWSCTTNDKNGVPSPPALAETEEISAPLAGVGVLANDYLLDGQWHHIAFVKNAETGEQAIWIDGQSPAPLRTAGNATGRVIRHNEAVYFNSRGSVSTCAALDEIALYESALPDSLIYQHFLDSTHEHRAYSTTDPGTAPPAPAPCNGTYDPLDYMPGTKLPTPKGNATAGVTATAVEQLRRFASPRYAQPQTLPPLYSGWLQPEKVIGGANASSITSSAFGLAEQQRLAVTRDALWRPGTG